MIIAQLSQFVICWYQQLTMARLTNKLTPCCHVTDILHICKESWNNSCWGRLNFLNWKKIIWWWNQCWSIAPGLGWPGDPENLSTCICLCADQQMVLWGAPWGERSGRSQSVLKVFTQSNMILVADCKVKVKYESCKSTWTDSAASIWIWQTKYKYWFWGLMVKNQKNKKCILCERFHYFV